MAAAALAAPAVSDATEKIAQKAQAEFEALAEDPIIYFGRWSRKIGALSLGVGIIFAVAAPYFKRVTQQFENDIDRRLGIQIQTPPTISKTPPPPPPKYIDDYSKMVFYGVKNVSSVDAKAAQASLYTAYLAADDAWKLLTADGAPPTFIYDVDQVRGQLLAIANDFGYVPAEEYAAAKGRLQADLQGVIQIQGALSAAQQSGAPQALIDQLSSLLFQAEAKLATDQNIITEYEAQKAGKSVTVNWAHGKENMTKLLPLLNTVASDFGQPQPFDIPKSGTDSGSSPQPWWDVVYNDTVGAVVMGAETVVATVANDINTIVADAKAIGADVGTGLAVMGKLILNLPMLAFDGLGFSMSWGVSTLMEDLGPPLIILGVGLLAFSWFALGFWPRLKPRLVLGVNAGQAHLWNRFDKWFHSRRKVQEVWTQKSTEGMIASANLNPVYVPKVEEAEAPPIEAPSVIEAGSAAEAERTKPEGGDGAVQPSPADLTPSGPTIPEGVTPGPPVASETIASAEPTKDELELQEKNRLESMPHEAPQPPPMLQDDRSAAKVMEKVLSRKPSSRKRFRGAMDAVNMLREWENYRGA